MTKKEHEGAFRKGVKDVDPDLERQAFPDAGDAQKGGHDGTYVDVNRDGVPEAELTGSDADARAEQLKAAQGGTVTTDDLPEDALLPVDVGPTKSGKTAEQAFDEGWNAALGQAAALVLAYGEKHRGYLHPCEVLAGLIPTITRAE